MKSNIVCHPFATLLAGAALFATLQARAAEPRPAATPSAQAPAARSDANSTLAGTWKGSIKIPQGMASLELTFVREGTGWKGAGKVKTDAPGSTQASVTAKDLQVKENAVSFRLPMEGADVKFTGTLAKGTVGGSLVAFEEGNEVGRGTWTLSRPESK